MRSVPSFLLPRKKTDASLLWIALGVILAHLAGTWYALYFSTPAPVKENRQKVIVKTVQLTPRLQPVADAVPHAPVIQEKAPAPAPQPVVPAPSVEKEAPAAAPVKIEPVETKPEPKVDEAPKLEPQKKAVVEQPKKAAAAPKKEPSAKTEEKAAAPKKPAAPPAKTPAQTPKKTAPKAKTTAAQAPVKKASETAKPKPKAEVKKGPSPEEIAALEAEAVKQKELEAARLHQQELLAKAQQSLAKIGESRNKIGSGKALGLAETDIPKQIANLQIDALPVGSGIPVQLSAKEASYRDEVAQRLKLGLRLPDYGEVKIKLTLSRSGKVDAVQIVSSESSKNKQYIERTVPTLIFPPFGNQFGNDPQYSFLITLNND